MHPLAGSNLLQHAVPVKISATGPATAQQPVHSLASLFLLCFPGLNHWWDHGVIHAAQGVQQVQYQQQLQGS